MKAERKRVSFEKLELCGLPIMNAVPTQRSPSGSTAAGSTFSKAEVLKRHELHRSAVGVYQQCEADTAHYRIAGLFL